MSVSESEQRPAAAPEEIREILRQLARRQKEYEERQKEYEEWWKKHCEKADRDWEEIRAAGREADRRLYGAVAYLKVDEGTVRYAMRKGLLAIRAAGSSASIVNEPGFEPRLFWRAAVT